MEWSSDPRREAAKQNREASLCHRTPAGYIPFQIVGLKDAFPNIFGDRTFVTQSGECSLRRSGQNVKDVIRVDIYIWLRRLRRTDGCLGRVSRSS